MSHISFYETTIITFDVAPETHYKGDQTNQRPRRGRRWGQSVSYNHTTFTYDVAPGSLDVESRAGRLQVRIRHGASFGERSFCCAYGDLSFYLLMQILHTADCHVHDTFLVHCWSTSCATHSPHFNDQRASAEIAGQYAGVSCVYFFNIAGPTKQPPNH